jgi:predicted NBD/HSP70 family sugar kinase
MAPEGLLPDHAFCGQEVAGGLGVSVAPSALKRARADGPTWQEFDAAFAALGLSLGLAVYVSSDAIASCSAELIYGQGGNMSDFAYIFVDETVSGGLVQSGRIRFSRDRAEPNVGRVLVPTGDAELVPLRELASVTSIRRPEGVESLARGIAYAIHAALSVVHFDAVMIDGSIPDGVLRRIVLLVRGYLDELDEDLTSALPVREGSRGRKETGLGAACLPLADRFFPTAAG